MKITLDIPDGIIAGFFNGVEVTAHGMQLVSYQLMVLDNEQAKQLVDYAVKKEVYNWDGVESVVAEALAHGNKVVINADW